MANFFRIIVAMLLSITLSLSDVLIAMNNQPDKVYDSDKENAQKWQEKFIDDAFGRLIISNTPIDQSVVLKDALDRLLDHPAETEHTLRKGVVFHDACDADDDVDDDIKAILLSIDCADKQSYCTAVRTIVELWFQGVEQRGLVPEDFWCKYSSLSCCEDKETAREAAIMRFMLEEIWDFDNDEVVTLSHSACCDALSSCIALPDVIDQSTVAAWLTGSKGLFFQPGLSLGVSAVFMERLFTTYEDDYNNVKVVLTLPDSCGMTPLLYVLQRGSDEAVRIFMEALSEVYSFDEEKSELCVALTHQDCRGKSPLMYAAQRKSSKSLSVLFSALLDAECELKTFLSSQDGEGLTALMYAVRDGSVQTIQILRDMLFQVYGDDRKGLHNAFFLINCYGESAYNYAYKRNDHEIMKVLREAIDSLP